MNPKRLWIELRTLDPAWPFAVVLVAACIGLLLLLPGCAGRRTAQVDARLEQSIEALDQARAELVAADRGSDRAVELEVEVERLRREVLDLAEQRAKALAQDTQDAGADAFWTALLALVAGPGAAVGLNVHRNRTRQVELDSDREALRELAHEVNKLKTRVPA